MERNLLYKGTIITVSCNTFNEKRVVFVFATRNILYLADNITYTRISYFTSGLVMEKKKIINKFVENHREMYAP